MGRESGIDADPEAPPWGPPQMWNHRIHQRWAGEDLTFWRLAFFPRYDFPRIVKTLHRVFKDVGVHSYAIYETLGLFDVFVRAWIPDYASGRFEEALNDALGAESLQLLDGFTVTRILRHWAWDDGNGGVREPSQKLLADPWKHDQIAEVDEGRLDEAKRAEYDSGLHVLRQMPAPDGEGVKFLTVITSSVYSMTYRARLQLEQLLLDILVRSEVDQASLYEGSGFGQFILMGRVKPAEFFKVPALAQAINETRIQDTVAARPYTFVSARDDLVYFADRLPPTLEELSEDVDLAELLRQGEGQRIEVKGAARLDWRRYLAGDGQLIANEKVLNEGIVKAIVGMLNADGGHIVVGALEGDYRYGEFRADEHPLLNGYPTLDGFVCVGVDDEYTERGWDTFQLQLRDLIDARVDPPPSGAIRIVRHEYEGRDLCVVVVKPTRATWYYRYVDGEPVKFFVREDGRTVSYAGSRADAVKRARPRG